MVFYTWNIITLHGHDEIRSFLVREYDTQEQYDTQTTSKTTTTSESASASTSTTKWVLDMDKDIIIVQHNQESNNQQQEHQHERVPTITTESTTVKVSPTTPSLYRPNTTIEFWCRIENNIGIGRAHIRLVPICTLEDDDDRQRSITITSTTTTSRNCVWKAMTVLTVMTELTDRRFQVGPNRNIGFQFGPIPNRKYWHNDNGNNNNEHAANKMNHVNLPQSQRILPSNDIELNKDIDDDNDDDNSSIDESYYVVIIGGGQAGLSIGARLQYLNVPYVILEAAPDVGASWQNRYPSLHLHDPCYYNHMPYLPFPVTWPIFCPRNKIVSWLQSYVKILDLNVRTNTRVIHAGRDVPIPSCCDSNDADTSGTYNNCNNNNDNNMPWNLIVETIDSDKPTNDGTIVKRTKRIQAHHIVFATGNSSHPRKPKFPGSFRGIQLHSSQYKGGQHLLSLWLSSKDGRNTDSDNKQSTLHVVVIGSNNSAFDICQDVWEQLIGQYPNKNQLQITMIQRSPSMVVSPESVLNIGLGPLYRQDSPYHHEDADFIATTVPYHMAIQKNWIDINNKMKLNDQVLHTKLSQAGYELDTDGPNGTGIFAKSATEGGGFYINMGCAELIIDRHVNVKFASVLRLVDDAVIVQKQRTNIEERVPADIVIYATGFGTMDKWVTQICGPDIAKQVGRTWGLGSGYNIQKDPGPWEGELRNMWKPTSVPGLWFQGGNLAQNRHYSRFLALQLAARYIGIDTPVFGIPKPTRPIPSNPTRL
jgi:putative flavoprotein involved in K+ transport